MSRIATFSRLLAAVMLSGCATSPMGPTAMVMPAQGKPFEAFAQEQAMCKQFASGEVDGGATMSNLKQLGTMAISTALGAGLGASVRGRRGAEFGGAVGAMGGASMAGQGSARDQYSLQGRYDLAYTQCMYSRGNQVAAAARVTPRLAYGPPPGRPPVAYQVGHDDTQGPTTYPVSQAYPQSPSGVSPRGYGMVR